jgi:PAS domain S-box-containing protein
LILAPDLKQPRRLFLPFPLIGATTAVLLAAIGLFVLIFLAAQAHSRLSRLQTAELDNSTWLFAQLEVDHLKLQLAANQAALAHEFNATRPPEQVSVAFDIFYSRVRKIKSYLSFMDQKYGLSPEFSERWVEVIANTNNLATLIDTTPMWDQQACDKLIDTLYSNADNVRKVAVLTLREIVQSASERHEKYVSLVRYYFMLTIAMIVLLCAIIIIVGKLAYDLSARTRDNARIANTLRKTIDASLEAILLIDLNGAIKSHNNAAGSTFQVGDGELVGQQASRYLVPPRFAAQCQAELDGLIKAATSEPREIKIICQRADGSEFVAEVNLVLEVDGLGEPVIVAFFRNIDEQAQAEAMLRRAKKEAERVAANKARFLAVVSHEMRTPLHGIMASLELVNQPHAPPEDNEKFLATARQSAVTALELIEEVLDSTDLERATEVNAPEAFRPDELAHEIARLLEPAALLNNTRIVVQNSWYEPAPVVGNRKAFRHALTNLVRNATKFTLNGEIIIRLRDSLTDPNALCIEVLDTGIGISLEDQSRIFEDFETGDQFADGYISGTGLGLGIVRRAVAALDGRLGVSSEKGEGSLFWFEIPIRAAAPVPAPEASPCARVRAEARGRKILVVDDKEINLVVLSRMLEQLGHTALTAPDGETALMIAAGTELDYILLDLNMPNMSGRDVMRHLREQGLCKKTPVIAVTANAQPGLFDVLGQEGFDKLLTKPLSLNTLCRTVSQCTAAEWCDPKFALESERKDLIDQSCLSDLLDLLGHEATESILHRALNETSAEIENLRNAKALTDGPFAERVHHAANALAMIGATHLHKQFNALEDALNKGDLSLAQRICEEAERCLIASRRAFAKLFETPSQAY